MVKSKVAINLLKRSISSHLAAIEKAEIDEVNASPVRLGVRVAWGLPRRLYRTWRGTVDAAFAEMANDIEYQQEALQIEAEFAQAS